MNKINIYLMPGLAAGPKTFENLKFDEAVYTVHYLRWIEPLNTSENIKEYVKRLSAAITEKDAVLIGVSFGGIIVQELAKIVQPRKVIIISSVKHHNEFPKRFIFAKKTKIYTLFPTKFIENFEDYTGYFLGATLQKKAHLYKKYLSVRSKVYLKWAIAAIIKWEESKPPAAIVHIHGTKDLVFPIENIKNAIEIEGGTHIMVLTKAKKISKIIDAILTC